MQRWHFPAMFQHGEWEQNAGDGAQRDADAHAGAITGASGERVFAVAAGGGVRRWRMEDGGWRMEDRGQSVEEEGAA